MKYRYGCRQTVIETGPDGGFVIKCYDDGSIEVAPAFDIGVRTHPNGGFGYGDWRRLTDDEANDLRWALLAREDEK